MGILSMFAAPFDSIINSIGDALDKNLTSDEEKMILRNELVKIQKSAELEIKKLEGQYESELTSRHAADMKSDDIWSKRIRPMSLAFLLLVVSLLAVADGNFSWNEHEFAIGSGYIDLFQTLLLTSFSFYFGGRSMEKIAKIKNVAPKKES